MELCEEEGGSEEGGGLSDGERSRRIARGEGGREEGEECGVVGFDDGLYCEEESTEEGVVLWERGKGVSVWGSGESEGRVRRKSAGKKGERSEEFCKRHWSVQIHGGDAFLDTKLCCSLCSCEKVLRFVCGCSDGEKRGDGT